MSVLHLRIVYHKNKFHFILVHICPFKSSVAVIAYGRMWLGGLGFALSALVAHDVCKVNLKSSITDHSHLNLIKSTMLWL